MVAPYYGALSFPERHNFILEFIRHDFFSAVVGRLTNKNQPA